MKRFLTALGVLAAVGVLVPASVAAGPAAVANGGGNGTFDGVVYAADSVAGHFECNMAGNAPFGGLHLMAVEGRVGAGAANTIAGTAWLSGSGTLHIDSQKQPVNFYVTVREGGPGVGKLQLTVTTPSAALVAAFPPETVMTGQISIH